MVVVDEEAEAEAKAVNFLVAPIVPNAASSSANPNKKIISLDEYKKKKMMMMHR